MNDLTAFQRDLLRIIAGLDEPMGLEAKRALQDYYGHEINHGRLYPNLNELVKMGLIAKREKDGRTNSYSLTRRGREDLRARDEWNAEHAPAGTSKNLKTEA